MSRAIPSNIVMLAAPQQGLDGRTTLSAARPPAITDGRIGDFFIDTDAKKLYGPKVAAATLAAIWPDNGLIKGDSGWAPLLAAVEDGSRRVQQVVDWTGGEGTKPATGQYVGATGLVADIADAVDVRGPQGPQALIDALTAAAADITDDSLISTAEAGDDNEKRAAVEVFDLGGELVRRTVSHAAASTVRKGISSVRIGNETYLRAASEPSGNDKFRTQDRWTDAGNFDSANGGWWVRDEGAAVRFDRDQALTLEKQAQGRGNIAAAPEVVFNILDYMADTRVPAVTDDSSAIQAMLQEACNTANSRGVRCRLPARFGPYVMNSIARCSLESAVRNTGLVLEGDGPYATKILSPAVNSYRFVVQGTWNAAANSPNLSAAAPTEGDVYIVTVAGTTTLGGSSAWNIGDQAYFNGAAWQKILAPAVHRDGWDASTNTPPLQSGIGREGDFYHIKVAGTTTLDGVSSWSMGDEVYYCQGAWRKKTVQAGTYKGTWNAATNTPTLGPGTGGVAGDWYVVTSSTNFQLDESNFWRPGDKIWFTGTVWKRFFASPTARGSWDPSTNIARGDRWDGDSLERANIALVSSQGAYGEWYYCSVDGSTTIDGNGSWLQDEIAYFNGSTWEKIKRDPNHDVGLFDITFTGYRATVRIENLQFCSLLHSTNDVGLNSGIALRVRNMASPINNGGAFSDIALTVQNVSSVSDDEDFGVTRRNLGVWEKIIETHNVSNPYIDLVTFSTALDQTAPVRDPEYPRNLVAAIHHRHAYLPRFGNVSTNGLWQKGVFCEGLTWDPLSTSWEGGFCDNFAAAECDEGFVIQHGRPSQFYEPTFMFGRLDVKAKINCIRIRGHTNVIIDSAVPIIQESDDPADARGELLCSGIYLEDACNVIIGSYQPNGGFYNSDTNCAIGIRVDGYSTGVVVDLVIWTMTGIGVYATNLNGTNGYDSPQSIKVRGTPDRHTGVGYTLTKAVYDPNGNVLYQELSADSAILESRKTDGVSSPIEKNSRRRSDFASAAVAPLGEKQWNGLDSGGTLDIAVRERASWLDNTATSEDSRYTLAVMHAGTLTEVLDLRGDTVRTLIPFRPPVYTISTLPTPATVGFCIAMISNGTSFRRLITCDGSAWRYADGSAV